MRALAFALLALLGAKLAWAQSTEELQRIIKERDAEIERLDRRIEALEQKAPSTPEDEEESNRALERALVQQGGLLLPARVYEVEPQLVYSHWDKTRSNLRDVAETALAFRAGLGWESQFQARVPYAYVSSATGSGSGFGDAELTLSRQLRREGSSLPSVVASLGWVVRTGRDPLTSGDVATGGGFDILQAGVLALKRQDPLVYFGGLSYASPRPRNVAGTELEPADSIGVRLGGILAASPHSSISVGVNLAFLGTARINGERVADSDTVLGTFQVSFGTILSRRTMLNVTSEVRMSGAVPDFRLGVTLPIRF
jgi:hypothetical protein